MQDLAADRDSPVPAARAGGDPQLPGKAGILRAATELAAATPGERILRSQISALLRQARDREWDQIRERFLAAGADGRESSVAIARMTDRIVESAYDIAIRLFHPNPTPTDAEWLSVIAVGGYGRGEMAPWSDVDLLFLTPARPPAWVEAVVETMLYLLWDARIQVGHAVRDTAACLRMAENDLTIRTTLLDMRPVCGDAARQEALAADTRRLLRADSRGFIAGKLEEREARHEAADGSRYLLNPDLKDGKGGLRDLQTLFWLARAVHGPMRLPDFVAAGLFEADEAAALAHAARDLWTWRFHLHYAAGRAEERLHFEYQEHIAEALGYAGRNGLRPVENFMRDYYRTAKRVGDLTGVLCAALEQRQEKERPGFRRLLARFGITERGGQIEGFPVDNGRLTLESDSAMEEDPHVMLRLFAVSQRTGALVHPDALRRIVRNLHLIDDDLRADPQANRRFLDILTARESPARTLRKMSETGVLGRFLPEFDHVVGLMQFDRYHHYTVDEHMMLALDVFTRIERGELRHRHPLASELVDTVSARRALMVAIFLHDVGKGLGGDHSEKGADIVARLCPRLGLDPAETDTAIWLTRHHLAMNHTAQQRDINDPGTVRGFATEVQDRERLALLLILTVCDLTSVAPDLWNDWKAQLIRDLYAATLRFLDRGQAALSTDEPVIETKQALRGRLADLPAADVAEFEESMPPAFWLGLDGDTHETIARMVTRRHAADCDIRLDRDDFRGATKACVYARDKPGLLAEIAAGFAATRATVVELRSYTSRLGTAVAVLWVQSMKGEPFEGEESARVENRVRKLIADPPATKPKRPTPQHRFPDKFSVPTRVRVSNNDSDLYTLLEVIAQDRPGLLADLAEAINAANAQIVSAIVSTYGDRAVDSFYVKNAFGLKISGPGAIRALRDRVHKAAELPPDTPR